MQNTSNDPLDAVPPNKMTKREHLSSSSSNVNTEDFQPIISHENPVEEYRKYMDEKVQMDEYVEDSIIKKNYAKIAAATQKCIWEMLFANGTPLKEIQNKAAELLQKHKVDACFFDPWGYNDWIYSVRDELIKKELITFWRDEIVKHELGPCWAKDSDYFDDMNDTSAEEFYRRAGCVAPFSTNVEPKSSTKSEQMQSSLKTTETQTNNLVISSPEHCETTTSLTEANDNSISSESGPIEGAPSQEATFLAEDAFNGDEIEYKISLETPLEDYKNLIVSKLQTDVILPDEVLDESYKKISETAREIIWQLLFLEKPLTEENQIKAAELLKEVKGDACFYGPAEYNNWIISLRDELLRQELIDFWREQVVKHELGPCWARDSDFFDDMDDPEPLEFYNYAGCEAPFVNEITNTIDSD